MGRQATGTQLLYRTVIKTFSMSGSYSQEVVTTHRRRRTNARGRSRRRPTTPRLAATPFSSESSRKWYERLSTADSHRRGQVCPGGAHVAAPNLQLQSHSCLSSGQENGRMCLSHVDSHARMQSRWKRWPHRPVDTMHRRPSLRPPSHASHRPDSGHAQMEQSSSSSRAHDAAALGLAALQPDGDDGVAAGDTPLGSAADGSMKPSDGSVLAAAAAAAAAPAPGDDVTPATPVDSEGDDAVLARRCAAVASLRRRGCGGGVPTVPRCGARWL